MGLEEAGNGERGWLRAKVAKVAPSKLVGGGGLIAGGWGREGCKKIISKIFGNLDQFGQKKFQKLLNRHYPAGAPMHYAAIHLIRDFRNL